jgi:hypothetical protein
MSQIELNKIEIECVLEAFDTLFNQRDYIAAEHYCRLSRVGRACDERKEYET